LTFTHSAHRRAVMAKHFGNIITKPEIILHQRMAKEGFRFKSQWRLTTHNGFFTVDFLVFGWNDVHAKHDIIVEVRGESHYSESGRRKDEWKTKELTEAGYPVIWIENEEVYKELPKVIEKIRKEVLNGGVCEG